MYGGNYFDKRTTEEDSPIFLDSIKQNKYQHLETIYEEFFEQNSLTLAKVIHVNQAKFKGRKR
jgi:hypothetical protein